MSEELQVPINNPLIKECYIPGVTVRLPSQGLLYKEGILRKDVKNGELTVNPVSAKDEVLLKSPEKLLNGSAVTDVFQKCIPQILKPYELFSKDVDFLLLNLKMVSYGNEYEVRYTHDCENAKEHSYTIDLNKIAIAGKDVNPTTFEKGFTLKLPNGQTVHTIPPTYRAVLDMYNTTDNNNNKDELQNFKDLITMIASVDEVDDPNLILEWILGIPGSWVQQIWDNIENNSQWGVDFEYDIKCKDCKKKVKIDAGIINPIRFFF